MRGGIVWIGFLGLGLMSSQPFLKPEPLQSQWDGKNGWFREARFINEEGGFRSSTLYVEDLGISLRVPLKQQRAVGSVWGSVRVIEGKIVTASLIKGAIAVCRSQIRKDQVGSGDFDVNYKC